MGLWLKQDDGTLVEVSGGSSDGGGTGADGADGKGWTGGTYDAATGVVTFTSDDGLEFTTGDLRGANGIDGLAGADGNEWHVGSGDPASTLGEPGDYYLDGEAGWVWVKRTNSSWTNLYVNLTGPPGEGAGEHDHNYAPPHDHPYAATSHTHSYAPTSHTHSYSPTSHTHDKVAGYGVSGGNAPPSGAQVIRSHTNGYTYLGWLNTVSGANTNEPTRIYTNNGGSDAFVRYMTPANFRKKVIDGHYAPTSHSHSYLPLSGGTVTGNTTFNGEVYTKKWLRCSGNQGVYFTDHGGGWNMTGSMWIEAYGQKGVLANGGFASNGIIAQPSLNGNQYMLWNTTFGSFGRYTSTREVKEQIAPMSASVDSGAIVDALNPVTFLAKHTGDEVETAEAKAYRESDTIYGFIAEEVCDIDSKLGARLGSYEPNDTDGALDKPAGWGLHPMMAVLVAEAKQLRGRVAELEGQVADLSARIAALEA